MSRDRFIGCLLDVQARPSRHGWQAVALRSTGRDDMARRVVRCGCLDTTTGQTMAINGEL